MSGAMQSVAFLALCLWLAALRGTNQVSFWDYGAQSPAVAASPRTTAYERPSRPMFPWTSLSVVLLAVSLSIVAALRPDAGTPHISLEPTSWTRPCTSPDTEILGKARFY